MPNTFLAEVVEAYETGAITAQDAMEKISRWVKTEENARSLRELGHENEKETEN